MLQPGITGELCTPHRSRGRTRGGREERQGGREGQGEREGGNKQVKEAKRRGKCTGEKKNGWEHAHDKSAW